MRARSLKPGFFKNEELASLDPLARILYEGLWCAADREGRLEDRPRRIKAEVLPYDDCDIDALLELLTGHKFIIRYSVNGDNYIELPTFSEHQNPHQREAQSKIPAYSRKRKAKPAPKLVTTKAMPSTMPDTTFDVPSPADSPFPFPSSLTPSSLTPGSNPSASVENPKDYELIDEMMTIATSVTSKRASWEPNDSDRTTFAALIETYPAEQLRRELGKFKAYAPQREYSEFGRAFASWMGRVSPEPKTVPRPSARQMRIAKARSQLEAGNEDAARAMCHPDEWEELAGIGRTI